MTDNAEGGPEGRDFSIFKPRTPVKLDEKTRAQLPLWRPYVCASCGSDNLQVEMSSDKDQLRLTCLDCESRTQLALQLPGKAMKAMPFKEGATWR